MRSRAPWPQMAVATVVVMVLPALVVGALSALGVLTSVWAGVLLAVVLSLALSSAGSAFWRRHASGDVLFSDLLLWGWLRRRRTERRLGRADELLREAGDADSARKTELLRELGAALDAQDPYLDGHSRRVARYVTMIAQRMNLSAEQVERAKAAATIHDVGKLRIPAEVVNKQGRLTDAEFELMKQHAAAGGEMVECLGDPGLAAAVRGHHERWDGSGYPDGLAGERIPVEARMISVADTFDAITSARPYRAATPHAKALKVIADEAGGSSTRRPRGRSSAATRTGAAPRSGRGWRRYRGRWPAACPPARPNCPGCWPRRSPRRWSWSPRRSAPRRCRSDQVNRPDPPRNSRLLSPGRPGRPSRNRPSSTAPPTVTPEPGPRCRRAPPRSRPAPAPPVAGSGRSGARPTARTASASPAPPVDATPALAAATPRVRCCRMCCPHASPAPVPPLPTTRADRCPIVAHAAPRPEPEPEPEPEPRAGAGAGADRRTGPEPEPTPEPLPPLFAATLPVFPTATPTPAPPSHTRDDCKHGGWRDLGYRNQGQCIAAAGQGGPHG